MPKLRKKCDPALAVLVEVLVLAAVELGPVVQHTGGREALAQELVAVRAGC